MEQNDFQKLLMETVICSIACDGDIDDREIAELHNIIDNAQYFKGIESVGFTRQMIHEVRSDGLGFVGNYFKHLEKIELSSGQELLLLEIIIRIIQADERIDENEVAFLKHVRSKLRIYDEIIQQRFGEIPYLTKGASKQFDSKSRTDEFDVFAKKVVNVTSFESKFADFLSQ